MSALASTLESGFVKLAPAPIKEIRHA